MCLQGCRLHFHFRFETKWTGKSETEAGVTRMSLTACFKQSILREGTFKYETRRRNKIRISASITIGIGTVNRYSSAKTFEANLFSFYSRIEVIVHRSIGTGWERERK